MKYDIIKILKKYNNVKNTYKVNNEIDCGNGNYLYEIDESYTDGLNRERATKTFYVFAGENGYSVYDRVRDMNKNSNVNNGVDLNKYDIRYYIWYQQNGETEIWLSFKSKNIWE